MTTRLLPHSNPTTSRAAAIQAIPRSRAARIAIVEFIAHRGAQGAIDEEIAEGCPSIHVNAVRVRRGECEARGMITSTTGEKRLTRSGNMAQVYHITATGLRATGLPLGCWHVADAEARS